MELISHVPARFEHSGIILLVKTHATLGDKMEREEILSRVKVAKTIGDLPKIGRDLIRLFVVGWENVNRGGKPVAFNYDLIYSAFPAELADTMMPALYKFILENVDILKQ